MEGDTDGSDLTRVANGPNDIIGVLSKETKGDQRHHKQLRQVCYKVERPCTVPTSEGDGNFSLRQSTKRNRLLSFTLTFTVHSEGPTTKSRVRTQQHERNERQYH